MTLKDILQQQSRWTYDIMAASTQVGEMIREDAITSVNLSMIAALAKQNGIEFSITSFQGAHLEVEFGADWLWGTSSSKYLVQAKRLDVVPRNSIPFYTINIPQLNVLIDASQTLSSSQGIDSKPAYVFYNSFITPGRPEDIGCTFVNAMVLRNYLIQTRGIGPNQQSATLTLPNLQQLGAASWASMFGG